MESSKDDSATDGENSAGDLPDSNSSLFSDGEKVLAYHGPRIYEAKVQKSELRKDEWRYFVHYLGWNKKWDEWVGVDHLMKHTKENVLKQQALDKKQGVDKNAKSGRSTQTKPKSSTDVKMDKDETKNSVGKGKKRKIDSAIEQMSNSTPASDRTHTVSCSTSQTNESDTDLRLEVTFNLSGGIIGGKNALKNRCLALLKTQVGPAYDSWHKVTKAKKDDLWETVLQEFKIPVYRKEEVLKEMGLQWKTWRKNLRSKYFEDLDINGIKALKDKVPEKEQISLSQWNEFINREATEAKLKQRDKGKATRAKKTDVHCLGRQSYHEKAEEMMRKDPLHQLPERSDVFIESRRQKKTGEFHPQIAKEMQKVVELRSSQDSSSPTTLDGDALTTLYGKDTRGRTRGVGPVCRTKLKAILPIRSEIEKAVIKSNVQMEQDMHEVTQSRVQLKQDMQEIKNSLNLILRAYSEGQKFPPQQFPSQHVGSLSSLSLQPTQHPTPASSSSCNIFSLSNARKIATGLIISSATPGTMVHGHVLADYERKVLVIDVVPGEEGQSLYLESQGCATTIKDTEGGWVFWPIWLLH